MAKVQLITVNERSTNIETDKALDAKWTTPKAVDAHVDAASAILNTRLDNIIIASGTSDAEVVDARGGYATLGNRLANPNPNLIAGYLPYYTAGGLVNSGIWTDGTNVGIGTMTPGGKLEISTVDTSIEPAIRLRVSSDKSYGLDFDQESNATGYFAMYSVRNNVRTLGFAQSWSVAGNGNVGIGFINPLSKCAINGGLHVGGDSDAGDNNLLVDGTITASGPVQLKGYTVATLPAGVQGMTAFVTDALAPTFLTTLVGGGAIITTAFFNGTSWIAQ